jgi:NAD(P)-dependent dehydrogenase (short-subunit alcohol dehydrogenase family)
MVKGSLITSQYFIKQLGTTSRGYIINISSITAVLALPGTDSYALSKTVQSAVQRYIAALNPNVIATSLHPGGVATAVTPDYLRRFSKDKYELGAGTALWLASEVAHFMNGRYMSANWSVEEVVERQEEIVKNDLLKFDLKLAPYAS